MAREDAAAKAAAKGIEYKNVDTDEVVKGTKVSYGVVNGQSVLAKPAGDVRGLVSAANRYSTGQNTISVMQKALEDLQSASGDQIGGTTLQKWSDSINTQLIGIGLKDAKVVFGEDGISTQAKIKASTQALINEYKRLLLQESQVSDLDLRTLQDSFGKQGFTGNVFEAINSLNNMQAYFQTQADKVDLTIGQFTDPYYYRNKDEFYKVQEYLKENRIYNFQNQASVDSSTGIPTISLVQSAQQAQNRQKAKI